MPLNVTDVRSNAPEQIEHAVSVIGRSEQARLVFAAIYSGKKRIKTAESIFNTTKLSLKQVLTQGKRLADGQIVDAVSVNGRMGYQKHDYFHRHKARILALVADPKKLARMPTKRRPAGSGATVVVRFPRRFDRTKPITIDDVDSFKAVRKEKPAGNLPTSMSETTFKNGVQKILKEGGQFKDWGGESNDLFTTRVVIKGKRLPAAFAFKGPGMKGKLVPGKLGKNGDQIQRLFTTEAEVFFVQHWREIADSVLTQMQAFAQSKSISTGRQIYYGIIDGQDSYRLVRAYNKAFKKAKTAKK